jgi:peptidoglycan/LPS O-acetylase OafA/YrhL
MMEAKQPGFEGSWYPGLDGVRAVAVTLVFLAHTVPTLILGIGWAGVQIFFVLSGFLITGILYDNRSKPRRWRNFYARRTLRIFPLFFFVWLVIAILTPVVHLQWQPIQALWPIYLGNYARFIAGSAAVDQFYIPVAHQTMEFGHFWSLAVEEQFYLMWPLVVFFVEDRRTLIRVCQVGIAAVLLLRIALFHFAPPQLLQLHFLYRATITQADAFLVGGLMAIWVRGSERDRLIRLASPVLIGSLAVFALFEVFQLRANHFLITTDSPWTCTWGFTVLDIASAGFILSAMRPGTLVYRVCTTKFLRRLGTYSYGFYVYHVLFLTAILAPIHEKLHGLSHRWWDLFDAVYFGFAFLVIFAVSALSYHFLEMPFLRLKGRFGEMHRNPSLPPPVNAIS